MGKGWSIVLVLVTCVVLPFLIWGDSIAAWSQVDPVAGTLAQQDRWAWLVGISLLVADIVIPVPTTSIVAGLGIIYGPVLGAAFSMAGSMLSATIGYGIGRGAGRPLARRFLGASLPKGEQLFAEHGGWIVAVSRWLPVLPEVISVIAGLHRMPFRTFLLAAFCGVVPFSAAFATLGHLGSDRPLLTLIIAAVLPVILWPLVSRLGVTSRAGDDG